MLYQVLPAVPGIHTVFHMVATQEEDVRKWVVPPVREPYHHNVEGLQITRALLNQWTADLDVRFWQ